MLQLNIISINTKSWTIIHLERISNWNARNLVLFFNYFFLVCLRFFLGFFFFDFFCFSVYFILSVLIYHNYKISYSFHSITWGRLCFLLRSLSNGWSLMLVSQLLKTDRMNNGPIPFLSLSKNSLIYQRNRKSRENIWNGYFFWTSISDNQ